MFYFSKSKYCRLWQCPKLLWLDNFHPELKTDNPALEARFDEGNTVGDLAMGLLGDYTEVTVLKEDGKPDVEAMKRLTKECIANGVINICEASFDYEGLYCAVDILHKVEDGYEIYEVKSSTEPKRIYSVDISYQKYVLEHCYINVKGCYVVHIDNTYVREDKLDISKLFRIVDVSDEVKDEMQNVPSLIEKARKVYSMEKEPSTDIGLHCRDPYSCDYWEHCTQSIKKPNVFDLYRFPFKKGIEYYKQGDYSFDTLLYDSRITNAHQLRQMLHAVSEQEDDIDKDGIRDFLNTLTYPLYFLDFETMQTVIPEYPGTKPYQQITFQYSLHYIENEGGELKHKEFLAISGVDPRRALAERLCEDIPKNVCVIVYNKTFECSRLKELSADFPDLAEHLLNIEGNIKDLLVPFQKGYYYNKAMGGSYSIKSVLPALFPDDPDLDYHNLEGVHNGGEAMAIFPKIKDMPLKEQQQARHNLLKYCELDTLAMVKVWQKLVSVTKE